MYESAPTEVELLSWNYDTKQSESKGVVNLWLLAKNLNVKQFAAVLDDWLNSGGKGFRDGAEIGKLMTQSHRTLQGLFIQWCLGLIIGFAKNSDPRWTDPRNEVAVRTAIKIKDLYEAGELENQPFI